MKFLPRRKNQPATETRPGTEPFVRPPLPDGMELLGEMHILWTISSDAAPDGEQFKALINDTLGRGWANARSTGDVVAVFWPASAKHDDAPHPLAQRYSLHLMRGDQEGTGLAVVPMIEGIELDMPHAHRMTQEAPPQWSAKIDGKLMKQMSTNGMRGLANIMLALSEIVDKENTQLAEQWQSPEKAKWIARRAQWQHARYAQYERDHAKRMARVIEVGGGEVAEGDFIATIETSGIRGLGAPFTLQRYSTEGLTRIQLVPDGFVPSVPMPREGTVSEMQEMVDTLSERYPVVDGPVHCLTGFHTEQVYVATCKAASLA